MEKYLMKLAKQLNSNGIRWGIGGSLLLKKYSLVDVVHDIDIIVSIEDIDRAVIVLDEIATRVTAPIKEEYSTKHFFEYELDGISIDVMSGFIIKHDCGSYEFIFDEHSIIDTIELDDIIIPYTSLEDWFIAYLLMNGREKKANIIRDYFGINGVKNKELIIRALEQKLPSYISEELNSILKIKDN